jgi:hypothetical protein
VYRDRNLQLSRIKDLALKFVVRIRTLLCPEPNVVDVVCTITNKTHFLFPDDFVEMISSPG